MAATSAIEQSFLELINHARLAPQENFERYISSWSPLGSDHASIDNAISYFDVSATALRSQVEALSAVEPLAWNDALNEAATGHSESMVATGTQAHYIDGTSPGSRATAAGYSWNYISENIFAYAKDDLYGHAGFMIDWGNTDTGIQDGAGHRVNIMNASVREVGIGVIEDVDTSSGVGPNVVTQNFGNSYRLADTILLGVVRSETDGNGYYSVGEGQGAVRIQLDDGTSDTTPDAGGYRIDTQSGSHQVTFSGGALIEAVTVTVLLGSGNAKLDLVDGRLLETTVNLDMGEGGADARFIGDLGATLSGNAARNVLEGNGLDNTLCGKGGRDRLVGGQGDDLLKGGNGADKLLGCRGDDKLKGNKGKDTLDGGKGDDALAGGSGNDRLNGGLGDDKLAGGLGDDVFLFDDTSFGQDRITDIEQNDIIRIALSGEAVTPAQLEAALHDSGNGLLYDHLADGLNTITFVGATRADIDLSQFDLG